MAVRGFLFKFPNVLPILEKRYDFFEDVEILRDGREYVFSPIVRYFHGRPSL